MTKQILSAVRMKNIISLLLLANFIMRVNQKYRNRKIKKNVILYIVINSSLKGNFHQKQVDPTRPTLFHCLKEYFNQKDKQ